METLTLALSQRERKQLDESAQPASTHQARKVNRVQVGRRHASMERPPVILVETRDWSGASPIRYPDPAIKILDPRFKSYYLGHTPLQRLYTGTLWAESPCWFGDGRYLLWSDIPNDRMLRWT